MTTTPQFIQIYQAQAEHIREELLSGLRATKAHASPKYLYNELGSKLFEAITCIPEYYPTRTEVRIFDEHAHDMAKQLPQGCVLIDLGAGNCEKAVRLFPVFQPARYVAVDISVDFLKVALERWQRQFPTLEMTGVGMDFSSRLILPADLALKPTQARVMFYPGSSIGNFTPEEALLFLKQVQSACSVVDGGGLLIGVDLVKSKGVLEAAYDDALGITAAFNRNMLLHFNTLAGTNFKLEDWKHIGLYNTELNRIEMHLEALRDLTVTWEGGERHFTEGERIHTENSYKWTLKGFEELLKQAGFSACKAYTDTEQKFAVFWAKA
ncbi:MAG: L-histidine N(alpha)-methyltransferase [Limnobacter sp.]|uniref:L-histidine N(alpha)-methyltransferase n=1 Tax=Limnobacter sp. TaxID=2003368 RepID=UPI0022C89DEA|nr:L-histidine N(alpha)-methyltransferase [Limnobacter sp.]MCZ8014846.1 L-histidine N(alpha)-methyltransferase [Limnobacter sp.]